MLNSEGYSFMLTSQNCKSCDDVNKKRNYYQITEGKLVMIVTNYKKTDNKGPIS